MAIVEQIPSRRDCPLIEFTEMLQRLLSLGSTTMPDYQAFSSELVLQVGNNQTPLFQTCILSN